MAYAQAAPNKGIATLIVGFNYYGDDTDIVIIESGTRSTIITESSTQFDTYTEEG